MIDARQLGELLLGEVALAAASHQPAGQGEVQAECLELGDGLGALAFSLGVPVP